MDRVIVCAAGVLMMLGTSWLAGCKGGNTPVDGARLFAANCAVCHGVYADGGGPAAAQIPQGVPDLRQIAARNDGVFPREVVRKIVDGRQIIEAHRSDTMPAWGEEFAAGDADAWIEALVDYVASIQSPD